MTTATQNAPITHLNYADAAEAAQRGGAWPQAAVLWRRALETLTADAEPDEFALHADFYGRRRVDCEWKS